MYCFLQSGRNIRLPTKYSDNNNSKKKKKKKKKTEISTIARYLTDKSDNTALYNQQNV